MTLTRKIIAVAALALSGAACYSTKPPAVSPPRAISSTETAAPKPDDGEGDLSQPLDSDDLAYLDNKPIFDPHKFVPSVDYPLLCDTCGQAESDNIHIKKPSPVPKSFTSHTPPAQPPYRQPAAPSGHYESYGLFGRKTRWVSNQGQYQPTYQRGGCSGPQCSGRGTR